MNINKRLIIVTIIALFAFFLAACGGGNDGGNSASDDAGESIATGDPIAGEEKYNQVCIACHGPGGEGIEGLGKDMTTSEFIAGVSDAELLAFVKKGRPVGDPDNTTGVDMPPKGGNPALTDEEIVDIIAYIRTLQE